MKQILSKNGVPIRFPEERWQHIKSNHPEMEPYATELLQTLQNPEFICKGDQGELKAVGLAPKEGFVIVVVYKEVSESDGFILTAHLGRAKTLESLKKREIIWKRTN